MRHLANAPRPWFCTPRGWFCARLHMLALAVLLLAGCASPSRLYEKGAFDDALTKSLERLRKGTASDGDIDALAGSFALANQRDIARLDLLLAGRHEARWDEIATLAARVHDRQERLRPYLPIRYPRSERVAALELYPSRELLVMARERAAAWNVGEGRQLLETARGGDKRAAREAFAHFQRTAEIQPGYPGLRTHLDEAEQLGRVRVHLRVENQTSTLLPGAFRAGLEETVRQELDQPWLQVVLDDKPCASCDLVARVLVQAVTVSPDGLQENGWLERKEVPDGFDYVLDARGNVMKDARGNDIKVPRTKELVAEVFETAQFKSARIEGILDILDQVTDRLVRRTPLVGEALFSNEARWYRGAEEALAAKTRSRLRGAPVAYPTADQLLAEAADRFRTEVGRALRRDRRAFQP